MIPWDFILTYVYHALMCLDSRILWLIKLNKHVLKRAEMGTTLGSMNVMMATYIQETGAHLHVKKNTDIIVFAIHLKLQIIVAVS